MRDDPWTAANRDKEQPKVTIPQRRKPTAETPGAPTKPTISDRSGSVKNLHPISQSLKELLARGNEQMIERARKRLSKRAKRGFRGYPIKPLSRVRLGVNFRDPARLNPQRADAPG
jgi:hypothetical protein